MYFSSKQKIKLFVLFLVLTITKNFAQSFEDAEIFIGHTQICKNIAISPDGKNIASASYDSSIKIWDLKGKCLKTIFYGAMVYGIAYSPDGKNIVSCGNDSSIKIWDLKGVLLNTLKGHESFIWNVAYSHDGKNIYSCSKDKTFRIWNLQGECVKIFRGHTAWVNSFAVSPNGKNVATASDDSTIRLWDLDGNCIKVFYGHKKEVISVLFGPDGKSIYSGSADKTIAIWDLDGKRTKSFFAHRESVGTLVLSPDKSKIMSSAWDGFMKIWNLSGELISVVDNNEGIWWANFMPNGKNILSSNRDFTLKLWTPIQEIIKEHIIANMKIWQKKGVYEKTADFIKRVNAKSIKTKALEFYKDKYENMKLEKESRVTNYSIQIKKYDPDAEQYSIINDLSGGILILKVPVNEAQSFKANFNRTMILYPSYELDVTQKKWVLKKLEFNMKDERKYICYNDTIKFFVKNEMILNSLDHELKEMEKEYNKTVQKLNAEIAINAKNITTFARDEVDKNIQFMKEVESKKSTFVLIIANEDYEYAPKANFGMNNGYIFQTYCRKILRIPLSNIHYFNNATYAQIQQGFKRLQDKINNCDGKAKCIFYYSGLGILDSVSNGVYLLPSNGNLKNIEVSVAIEDLYKKLCFPSDQTSIFLDIFLNGTVADTSKQKLSSNKKEKLKDNKQQLLGNSVAFSAFARDESSFTYKEKRHTIFTYHLLKKISVTEGSCSFGELYNYLNDSMQKQTTTIAKKSINFQVNYSNNVKDDWRNLQLN